MSKENLDQFIQKVTGSEELQVRIGKEIETDALIALGAEHGCEFNAEDVQAVWGVSDDDLDGVVGGAAYVKFNVPREPFFARQKNASITAPLGLGLSTPLDVNSKN